MKSIGKGQGVNIWDKHGPINRQSLAGFPQPKRGVWKSLKWTHEQAEREQERAYREKRLPTK
jgi:hypothetical protein